MKTEKITIANLKCSGCETTIKSTLSSFKGVEDVVVSREENSVTVNFSGELTRKDLTNSLESIGYPEATAENGLLNKLRSV